MFLSASLLKKIENLLKRALRFLYNDFDISYEELLLKSDRATMSINRSRLLCNETYKTINNLNPEFMRDLFSLRETYLRKIYVEFEYTSKKPSYHWKQKLKSFWI